MSIFLGPIRQVGHIVRDIDESMEYWTSKFGIGPFFIMRKVTFTDFYYRGVASRSPVVSLAFAQSGDVQIELIQQHDDAPSAYREFHSAGREGMQHLSPWFDTRESYDAAREELLKRGLTLVHEVRGDGLTPRFCYFETGAPHAPLMELSEAMLPHIRAFPDTVSAESKNWDGTLPVRDYK